MRENHPWLIVFFFIAMLCACGCTQTAGESNPDPVPHPPSASLTTVPAVIGTPAVTPDPPEDLIVGSWAAYGNLPRGDRIKRVYTFMENNTWREKTTNLKLREQELYQGIWRKENDNNYWIKPSGSGTPATYQYSPGSDELFDTQYQMTFYRTSDSASPTIRVQTLNLTLHEIRKVSKLQGWSPFSGNKFLIVNVSIKNINETGGYSFDEMSLRVLYDGGDSISLNKKTDGRLRDPIPFGTIASGETRQGNVIFSVPEKSDFFTLKLVNTEGDAVSNIIELENNGTVPANSSETD